MEKGIYSAITERLTIKDFNNLDKYYVMFKKILTMVKSLFKLGDIDKRPEEFDKLTLSQLEKLYAKKVKWFTLFNS